MKRIIILALAAVLLLGLLTACGDTTPPDLTFTNHLESRIDNLYVSPADQDEWNDPVTTSTISKGSTFKMNFDKLGEGAGPGIYDVGAIDENGMNYDMYEVDLQVGDQIDLSGNADAATFVITRADGTSETVEAYIYSN